jgi:hypothetical protein
VNILARDSGRTRRKLIFFDARRSCVCDLNCSGWRRCVWAADEWKKHRNAVQGALSATTRCRDVGKTSSYANLFSSGLFFCEFGQEDFPLMSSPCVVFSGQTLQRLIEPTVYKLPETAQFSCPKHSLWARDVKQGCPVSGNSVSYAKWRRETLNF